MTAIPRIKADSRLADQIRKAVERTRYWPQWMRDIANPPRRTQ